MEVEIHSLGHTARSLQDLLRRYHRFCRFHRYFSAIMQLLPTAALFTLATATALVAASSKEPPKTLQIGITHKVPEAECKIKSQNGDKLQM